MPVFPVTQVTWPGCWRIIPSRFPPIDLLERVAPREDWSILQEIETLTNERISPNKASESLVQLSDWLSGPGTSLIMAPFCHPNPDGDHFTDGSFGIAYALPTFEAALARSIRAREQFLRRTDQGPIQLQMRVLNLDLSGALHDLRGHIANDYRDVAAARALSRNLRAEGSYGFLFDDITPDIGTTVAAFRPVIFSNCRQERHLSYKWDGTKVAQVYDYTAMREL